jgi:hypothetical protein
MVSGREPVQEKVCNGSRQGSAIFWCRAIWIHRWNSLQADKSAEFLRSARQEIGPRMLPMKVSVAVACMTSSCSTMIG